MRNVVGSIAAKEDFYPRSREIKRIIRVLEAGGNLQLSAPRRVGKSSILIHLKDNPMDDFYFVYVDVESARDLQGFFRKVYQEILRSDILTKNKRIWEHLKAGTNRFFKRLKSVKLGDAGEITLNEDAEVDFEEELLTFLSGIELGKTRLVILIDEFPEVLLNIVQDKKGKIEDARHFLQVNRALRNNDVIRGRIQFVYTGSSSLNVTAKSLNSTELINDITAVPIEPLRENEATDFVRQVLLAYNYTIEDAELDYLIKKVEWLIPFYFQLLIQEIISLIEPDERITVEVIDTSLEKLIGPGNDHHFEHYVKRLKRIFQEPQYGFVRLLLSKLCQTEHLTRSEIYDIAYNILSEDQARQVIDALRNDGYLVFADKEIPSFKFNSTIFKNWWYNHEG